MNDSLLKELGKLARSQEEAERARLDERWDRLAAGTLTAEEEAELKALADSSPEAREAYAAFQPLGADFQARVVSAINAERASEKPEPENKEERPRVLPFRRVARRVEAWIGVAAAVAATVFFLMHRPAMQPMDYEVYELSGGIETSRGGKTAPSSGIQVFVPDAPLTFTIKPQTAVQDVEAYVLLSSLSGKRDFSAWESAPHLQITDQGTVRLQGRIGQEIRISPGDWRIWIVVGRRGRIPPMEKLQAELRADRTRDTDWQAFSTNLRIKTRASP